MKQHTITKAEMNAHRVEQQIAGSAGGNITKNLFFIYNIGNKRLGYELRYQNDGAGVEWFDKLEDAIEAYNEL